jgi:hypothetical protein
MTIEKPKKKRGRPAPDYGVRVYPGCGRKMKMRDGVEIPCECPSCKARP